MAIMEIQKTTELPVTGVPSDGLYFVPVGDIGGEVVTPTTVHMLMSDAKSDSANYGDGISINEYIVNGFGAHVVDLMDNSTITESGAVLTREFVGNASGFKFECLVNVTSLGEQTNN